MKITVNKTVPQEVEIELPHYRKSNCHFWKIISDKTCICVTILSGKVSIDNSITPMIGIQTADTESTEQEFNEAFHRALSEINSFDIPRPLNEVGELSESLARKQEEINQQGKEVD